MGASRSVATLHSGPYEGLMDEGLMDDAEEAGYLQAGSAIADLFHRLLNGPTCFFLPDSTLCASEPQIDRVRVCSLQGDTLGSATVHFEISPDPAAHPLEGGPTELQAVVPSPCGSFLAAQSHQSLLVLSTPSCSKHMELALSSCGLRCTDDRSMLGVGPITTKAVLELWWSADSQSILLRGTSGSLVVCSVPRLGVGGGSWQQVRSPELPRVNFHVHGWLTCGVLVTLPGRRQQPGSLAVLEPTQEAACCIGDAVPQLSSPVCSPDKCWVAAMAAVPTSELLVVHARSGRVAARWHFPRKAPEYSLVWAQDGSAMVCQGDADSYLLRFG